jgi:hypothetical protein
MTCEARRRALLAHPVRAFRPVAASAPPPALTASGRGRAEHI